MHVYRGLALCSIAPERHGWPLHALGQYDVKDNFFGPNCTLTNSAHDTPSWCEALTRVLHCLASSHKCTFATSAASTEHVPPLRHGLEWQLPMAHVLPVQPGSQEQMNASPACSVLFESNESVHVPCRHGSSEQRVRSPYSSPPQPGLHEHRYSPFGIYS